MDAIKDVYLNPSFQSSKFKIEFRIPKDKVFSSKIKIQKLGFKNITNTQPLLYSISGGAVAMDLLFNTETICDNDLDRLRSHRFLCACVKNVLHRASKYHKHDLYVKNMFSR